MFDPHIERLGYRVCEVTMFDPHIERLGYRVCEVTMLSRFHII